MFTVILTLAAFTLMLFFNTHAYAWHENLGIDANKAAELYRTNPNDPAIIQWKNALQSAINDIGECVSVVTAMSCRPLMSTIISNCNLHPNELLACNDSRIVQYAPILKQAQEEYNQAKQLELKFEKCLEEGGTFNTCKLKIYPLGNKSQ